MSCKSRIDRRRSQLLRELSVMANNANGACVASDRYLAQELGCSPHTVQRDLAHLESKGLIQRTTDAYGRRNKNPAYRGEGYYRLRTIAPIPQPLPPAPVPEGATLLSNGVVLEQNWRDDPTLRIVTCGVPVPIGHECLPNGVVLEPNWRDDPSLENHTPPNPNVTDDEIRQALELARRKRAEIHVGDEEYRLKRYQEEPTPFVQPTLVLNFDRSHIDAKFAELEADQDTPASYNPGSPRQKPAASDVKPDNLREQPREQPRDCKVIP